MLKSGDERILGQKEKEITEIAELIKMANAMTESLFETSEKFKYNETPS